MRLICLWALFLSAFLTGCEQMPDQMEEVDKIVLSEEEKVEWSLPQDKEVATGELSAEDTLEESLEP